MLHSFASVSSKSSSGSVISFVLENWNRGGGLEERELLFLQSCTMKIAEWLFHFVHEVVLKWCDWYDAAKALLFKN